MASYSTGRVAYSSLRLATAYCRVQVVLLASNLHHQHERGWSGAAAAQRCGVPLPREVFASAEAHLPWAAPMVEISPAEVNFDLGSDEPFAIITVTNISETVQAFKVKTTMPKRYLVRPNQDIVAAGGSAGVKIILQAKERHSLVANPLPGSKCKDKFLVQSVQLSDEQSASLEAVKAKDTKEFSTKLADMWKTRSKDDFKNIKLKCTMSYPASTTPSASASASSAAGVAATPSPSKPEALAENASPYGTASQSPLASTPASAAAVATSTQDDGESDQKLRQRYSELVNYTVQLTAERDRIKNDYLEANKQLSQLREQATSRRQDAVSGIAESQAAAVRQETKAVPAVQAAGFKLWQLVLVAVISFLLARLFGA